MNNNTLLSDYSKNPKCSLYLENKEYKSNIRKLEFYIKYLAGSYDYSNEEIIIRYNDLILFLLWLDNNPIGRIKNKKPIFLEFVKQTKIKNYDEQCFTRIIKTAQDFLLWAKATFPNETFEIPITWIKLTFPIENSVFYNSHYPVLSGKKYSSIKRIRNHYK